MNLDQKIAFWKEQLTNGKSVNRVLVRRILEMDGAERRGIAISRRIAEKLENSGLKTVPDFQSAWIDAPVSIRLANESVNSEDQSKEGSSFTESSVETASSLSTLDTNQSDLETGEEEPSKAAAPVAEPLNSPAGDAGVAVVPAASTVDAILRISSIPSANRGVVTVLEADSISKATTLMSLKGYSQLAIMQGVREVRGMITWESIVTRSMRAPKPATVGECRIDAQVIDSNASLFDAFLAIEKFGYVLARSKERYITGIVTSADFAAELNQHTYAFICIRTIEMLVRKKLHPQVLLADLAGLEEHSRARLNSDPALLTFGENIRLLEHDQIWARLNVIVDRTEVTQRLHDIREVRNEVMHFSPDPLDDDQKKSLKQMEDFLRQVFV